MKKLSFILFLSFLYVFLALHSSVAATVEENFKIEGLISPASPKALKAALEKKLQVKVLDLNLKKTASGWPETR